MTEHERRVHDKTIKAYEKYDVADGEANGVPKIGQNYSHIQQKYITKAFGGSGSPTGSPMMNNAKRPNLNEVVTVQTGPYMPNLNSVSKSTIPTLNGDAKRAPSSLALAGSMNVSTKGVAPALY